MTKEQEQYVLDNYKKYDKGYICSELGINRHQLNYFLNKNNLVDRIYKPKKSEWASFSEEDILYIKKNYMDMTYEEIGKELGFTSRQIRGKVSNLGLRKNREINTDYFSKIDTCEKSYFVGFLFADGWVVFNEKSRNYELGMELQSCDKYVLEKLNDELGGKNKITHIGSKGILIRGESGHRGDSDRIRIYSKQIVSDLINIGVSQNKTKNDIFPIVPDEFFFDFLRGYIDGDGCYYGKKNRTYMHITCASTAPLIYLKEKLAEYDIKTHIYSERENKHRISCTDSNSMKILINHLYHKDGLFCLERKYEKIKHLIGFAA